MTDEFTTTIKDGKGQPVAIVSATALNSAGNKFVEVVREAMASEVQE